jgi:Leucine-rich repeat (LRR) protein
LNRLATAEVRSPLLNFRAMFRLRRSRVLSHAAKSMRVEHIGGLTKLKVLYLEKTKITDAGLRRLGALKNLKVLHLSDTSVTDTGVEKLQRTLTRCYIEREKL